MTLSFLKYNFQMAQAMQWLHAILNYMKKVKLSISMVPPIHPSNKGLLFWFVLFSSQECPNSRPKAWRVLLDPAPFKHGAAIILSNSGVLVAATYSSTKE